MVQKLTSVINGFLLFRPLVNGLGMSTRLKNKPELCLNRTKSWSTGRSYFVVGVVLSTVCPAFTLVAIQTLQLCTCSLEIKLKINLKFKLKEVQSFSCACFINCLLFSCAGFVDPWTQKHAVMHGRFTVTCLQDDVYGAGHYKRGKGWACKRVAPHGHVSTSHICAGFSLSQGCSSAPWSHPGVKWSPWPRDRRRGENKKAEHKYSLRRPLKQDALIYSAAGRLFLESPGTWCCDFAHLWTPTFFPWVHK